MTQRVFSAPSTPLSSASWECRLDAYSPHTRLTTTFSSDFSFGEFFWYVNQQQHMPLCVCIHVHVVSVYMNCVCIHVQGGIGVVLCEGQKNEGIIPLNKNLWSVDIMHARTCTHTHTHTHTHCTYYADQRVYLPLSPGLSHSSW